MNLTFTTLNPEHAAIAPYLRDEDAKEIYHMTGMNPDIPVAFSIAASDKGYAAFLDDNLCAVFGTAGNVIWLVATDTVTRYPVTFYRQSRRLFRELAQGHDYLHNYVHEDNTLSLRWLQWLGFLVEKPVHRFHHVYWKED